jgi:DNA-binding YbaB/EbfC family protein
MPMTEGFDPQSLLAQALEMQQRLVEAQEQAANAVIEGSAGGGKVKVIMTGTGEVTAVRIDPSVVDPAEVDLLEDLVVAALRDAATRVAEQAGQGLGLGDLGGALGGLGGLGALGDLFGGGALGGPDPDEDDDDDEEG